MEYPKTLVVGTSPIKSIGLGLQPLGGARFTGVKNACVLPKCESALELKSKGKSEDYIQFLVLWVQLWK